MSLASAIWVSQVALRLWNFGCRFDQHTKGSNPPLPSPPVAHDGPPHRGGGGLQGYLKANCGTLH